MFFHNVRRDLPHEAGGNEGSSNSTWVMLRLKLNQKTWKHCVEVISQNRSDTMFTKIDSKAPQVSHRLIYFGVDFGLQAEHKGGIEITSHGSYLFPFLPLLATSACFSRMDKFAFPPASRELRLERPHRGWGKQQQRNVGRHGGGGSQQGSCSRTHLQCLMNDGNNDWWYLGGLGENTWVVLSNTSTLTHVRPAPWLRRGHCGVKQSNVSDRSDRVIAFVCQSK